MNTQQKAAVEVIQSLIGQSIRIAETDHHGKILAIRIDTRGMVYLIAYWCDGRRFEEWLFADEIILGSTTSC